MTFSTLASPGVSLQGGGGSGGGGGGTPGGSNTQIQYNSSGTFAGASGLTTTTGTELTIASGTKTADAPVLNMSQTWNNSGVTFTGLKFNVADTASTAASLLMDLQVGGSSRFGVLKDGNVYLQGGTSVHFIANSNGGGLACNNAGLNDGTYDAVYSGYGPRFSNSVTIGWAAASTVNAGGGSPDTILTRRGAANLRLGAADAAAPVAQTLSVQSVVAGTTNTAGANLTITGSQGTGTGAGGSIIFQVAPAGSTGTAQNGLVTAWAINSVSQFVSGNAGTASAPSLVLSGADTGFFSASVGAVGFVSGGNESFRFEGVLGFGFRSAGLLWWTSGSNGAYSNRDLVLARDAANTLALRNGNEGQTFRLYGRFTDITNDFERFFINAPTTSGAAVLFGTQKGATAGTARALALQTDGTTRASWAANGTVTFNNNSSYTIDQFNNITWGFNLISGTSMRANLLEIGNASDTILTRDNTAILAQRNGTNAQEFRWYRTFTDSSNRQNGALKTAASEIIIEAQTAGTGADDIDVTLTPAGTGNVRFGTHTATSDTAVSGYIEIKDAGGTIRKLAIIT